MNDLPSKRETTAMAHMARDLVQGREDIGPGFRAHSIYDVEDTLVRVGTLYDWGVGCTSPSIIKVSLIEDSEERNEQLTYKETEFLFWALARGKFPYRAKHTQVAERIVTAKGFSVESVHVAGVGAVAALEGKKMPRGFRKQLKAASTTRFDRQYHAKLSYFLTACDPESLREVGREG